MMSFVPQPSRPLRAAPHAVRAGMPAVLLLLLWICVFAIPAQAQFELVTFDLTSESSLSLLGGTIVTPPDGSLTVGSLTLLLPSSAPGVPTPGAGVVLQGFTLAGDVSKNVAGQAFVSGPFAADQVGPVSGSLSAGLTEIDFTGQSLSAQLDVNLGCVGAGCSLLGFPVSESGVSLFELGVLSAFSLDQAGSARVEGLVDLELGGVLGTFDLVGIESSRVFVPEPGTALLLGAGLALMGRRVRARG